MASTDDQHSQESSGATMPLVAHIRIMMSALSIITCRSGGAGGQHVNTTDSAVILRLPLWAIIGLNDNARQRLRTIAGRRINNQDVLSLRCDQQRSQHDNRSLVWDRLRSIVTQALAEPKKRYRSKPTRGSIQRRLQGKKIQSNKKQRRQDKPEDWE